MFYSNDDIVEKTHRTIPHIQMKDQIISINWKLFFVLPYPMRLKEERAKAFLRKMNKENRIYTEEEYRKFMQDMLKWDNLIATLKCEGVNLSNPEMANIIQYAFSFYDNKLYELHCYCIMPNHIHILIRPLINEKGEYYHLSDIVKRLKTYTAKAINQRLKRKGKVWEDNYFDRYIRNDKDYYNVINYYFYNPAKAGLVEHPDDWEYFYIKNG